MILTPPEEPERFGPFFLLRALGGGGMGTAHLAFHADTGRLMVVKRLHASLREQPTMLERFAHEAEVATYVQHAHVARVVAIGAVETEPFLATEFVFGVQLSTLVKRIELGSTAPAPLGPALHLAVDFTAGLMAIHAACHPKTKAHLGLLHRDLGSRNIMLGYDGYPRIIDLGLGKSVLSDWETSAEVLAGSPDYMPPEQVLGQPVDVRADIYALAVSIWELLAGRKRIREDTLEARVNRCMNAQPEPIRAFRPEASRRLEQLLMEAMSPSLERRTPSAQELYDGLLREKNRLAVNEASVMAWINTACATLRARDSRQLEADLALGRALMTGGMAARPEGLAPPPALSRRFIAPSFVQTPLFVQRWRGVGGGILVPLVIIAICVAAMVAHWTSPNLKIEPLEPTQIFFSPVVASEPPILLETHPTHSRLVESSSASVEVEPLKMVRAVRRRARKGRRPVNPERKKALIQRIRALRQRSFDVAFQREVTRLSARLSRAGSAQELDALADKVQKLEEKTSWAYR